MSDRMIQAERDELLAEVERLTGIIEKAKALIVAMNTTAISKQFKPQGTDAKLWRILNGEPDNAH